MDGRAENPLLEENKARSSAWSPMAMAGRGVLQEAVDMIPKGMLAREKCEVREIGSHDFAAMIATAHRLCDLIDLVFFFGFALCRRTSQ